MTITEIGQLLADLISTYMGLDPARVILADEGFDGPTDDKIYVLVINDPLGAETIGINSSVNSTAGQETMGRAAHERFAVEVVSRGRDATNRWPEVLMALQSVAGRQAAESAGVAFFRGGSALDLSAIEGVAALRRYRIPVIVSNVQVKTTTVPMIDKFPASGIQVEA